MLISHEKIYLFWAFLVWNSKAAIHEILHDYSGVYALYKQHIGIHTYIESENH